MSAEHDLQQIEQAIRELRLRTDSWGPVYELAEAAEGALARLRPLPVAAEVLTEALQRISGMACITHPFAGYMFKGVNPQEIARAALAAVSGGTDNSPDGQSLVARSAETADTRGGGHELDAALSRSLDLELGLRGAEIGLAELEAKLRGYVIQCCDGRDEFCESYGCSTIDDIAARLLTIRREVHARIDGSIVDRASSETIAKSGGGGSEGAP